MVQFIKEHREAKVAYQKGKDYLKSLGIDFEFTVASENPAWGKDSWGKFNFLLTFKKHYLVFTSYFSQSCKTPFSFGKQTIKDKDEGAVRLQVQNRYPDIFGALGCYVSDSDCMEYAFEDWADNLGYDSDSRKAEKTYKACLTQTKAFTKLFNVEEVRQYLEDNELN